MFIIFRAAFYQLTIICFTLYNVYLRHTLTSTSLYLYLERFDSQKSILNCNQPDVISYYILNAVRVAFQNISNSTIMTKLIIFSRASWSKNTVN